MSQSSNKQILIDQFINDNKSDEPEIVKLKDFSEYDSNCHNDKIIIFSPGGKVGDSDWKFQYMHNINVIMKHHYKKKPLVASETYLYIEDWSKDFTISFYYKDYDLLIDRTTRDGVRLGQLTYDIIPPLPTIHDKSQVYFINDSYNQNLTESGLIIVQEIEDARIPLTIFKTSY